MNQPTWIGRTLSGRYKIEALLGQGGMSAVYKATDPNLKRVVAVKLIHPHLSSDPSFVIRFKSEASAVASLRHPNIVQVFDFNNDGDIFYMVLEFIPGETLQERMQRLNESGRKLSIKDALTFTINICDAVGYAHQRGMVHRDIKPANIMLDVQGQAILMDFGIVKILGGESHTSTGAVVGTARYMSPEIIRGEVADHRADIYSLGVTLYEMLSGRPPFMADSAMTLMMMHLNDPIPNVRDFRADIHPELVAVLVKSLAKDRADRYQSAAEMAADLRRALAYMGGQQTAIRVPVTRQSQPVPPKPEPKPAPVTESVPLIESAPQPLPSQSLDLKKITPTLNIRLLGLIFGVLVVLVCLGLAARSILNNLPSAVSSPTVFVTSQPVTTSTPSPTETLIPPTPTLGIGSILTSPKDELTLIYVPAGEFTMGGKAEDALTQCQKFRSGCQSDWFKNEEPPHTVDMNAFWIDKTEITNAMYALCVETGTCNPPSEVKSYTRDSYYGNPDFDNYPVIYVSWD